MRESLAASLDVGSDMSWRGATPYVSGIFDSRVLSAIQSIGAGLDKLLPAERALVARAGRARQREFATGRILARTLMARMNIVDVPVLMDPHGAPLWPHGVIGSISHARGLCLAVLARRRHILGLGADLEPNESLEPDLLETICNTRERDWLARRSRSSRGSLARLIFSAKECAYKCQYPLTGAQLDYHDVEIQLHRPPTGFTATLRRDAGAAFPRGSSLHGKYRVFPAWIVTGMVLPV